MKNPKDLWAGLLFLAIGLGAVAISSVSGYEVGSARHMGPGYFPIWLGGSLAFVGLVLAGKSLATEGPPLGQWALKPLGLITLGTLLFAAIVNVVGLAPAIVVLVLMSSLASVHFKLAWAVPLAVGLAVACVLIFIKGLGIAVPAMPLLLGY